MGTIAICTIVKNAATQLRTYLNDLLPFADEIVIVDNNSSDETFQIAKEYGISVYRSDEKFDLARNVYFSKATTDWILTLDLDERILPTDYNHLKNIVDSLPSNFLCGIVACNNYFGNGYWSTWYLPRLIKNTKFMNLTSEIHASYVESVIQHNGALFWTHTSIHHFDAFQEKSQLEKRSRNIDLIIGKLLSSHPDYKLLTNLACELFAINHSSHASLEIIRKACSIQTDNSDRCFRYYANIAFYQNSFQECIKAINTQYSRYLSSIRENDPRSPRSILELDTCRMITCRYNYAIGNTEQALNIVNLSIQENPDLPHNYINKYIITGKRDYSLIQKAQALNPLLQKKTIYQPETPFNLYHLSSSIIIEDKAWHEGE